MRIISQYFSDVEGITVFPVIGMFVSISFFLFLIYYVVSLSAGYVNELSNMPLKNDFEENEEINNNKEFRHGE